SFEYTVTDNDGDSDDARVTITVLEDGETNHVPVAIDDAAETEMNTAVEIDILANDSELEDGFGSITIHIAAKHGDVTINPTHTITYTPWNMFVGSDSLEYTVSDSHGDHATAKVRITVIEDIDYTPVANDDARGTSINTEVSVDVLTNDTGLEDGGLILTIKNNPLNGTFNVNIDNTITYTPNNNYLGTDVFEYQVCDADGDCSAATVTITVRKENSVPIALNDKVITGLNTDIIINVLGNDSGLDDGGIIVSVENDAVNGSLIVNADNTITYSPDNGFEGTEIFSYRVTDADGDFDIANVEVIVMSGPLPGISISAISGNTDETGTEATFAIVLNTQPTEDVNIDLNSDDITEGIVSESRLTFTASNWNTEQSVTVTGQNDDVDDDDISYIIRIDNAVSADPIYNELTISNISIINIDDDTAGITVKTDSLETTEEGGSIRFKIVLNSEPLEDVSLELASDDLSEGMLEIIDVLFTSSNWTDTVYVMVIGQDDDEIDGDITYSVTISPAVSLDPKYENLNAGNISLVNTDNDSRELTIPEAFSPGDDGFNDYFEIVNLEHYEKAGIRIYNRWGSLVYSNDNYQNDWDGKSNIGSGLGAELPMGTYFYILEIKGESKKINGSVFIKR
ncbi:MAG TPA: hypothetical protein DCG75_06040, partial [Bacteroidales bacterium]|nr:hypothetical protein [Bacteroidales bacterium]